MTRRMLSPGQILCQLSVIDFTSRRIRVELMSSKRRAQVTLLSYTKSCDIHKYWFPCAFNSDSSPPDHPATVRWLVKITQDPPVCTNTHQRGPSASLDVGGGFDFTRSSMKGLCLSRIVVLQMTLVESAAQHRGAGALACALACAGALACAQGPIPLPT
ncbi:hypothetical protein O181_020837 [Austropuccinia psidii MF-1]|uniref:Uncharacterized protein n=1 Tax=Austropuccinia psidii MF-1 TaxID=1389203 RepID=A0A9Q3GVP5_9BASI|nr:hypothetical protein [Austropuccinia psidii MF-1]